MCFFRKMELSNLLSHSSTKKLTTNIIKPSFQKEFIKMALKAVCGKKCSFGDFFHISITRSLKNSGMNKNRTFSFHSSTMVSIQNIPNYSTRFISCVKIHPN